MSETIALNVGPGRQPTEPGEGAARVGIWTAILLALVPALQAAIPALAVIPAPILAGALGGVVAGLGKIARNVGGQLWGRIGRLF